MIALPSFTPAPELGKLACAGSWETSVSFQRGELISVDGAASLVAGSADVACEAFFGSAFFGMRRTGSSSDLARDVSLFARCLAVAHTGHEFFDLLQAAFDLPLLQVFAHAEIGAEGAWLSVGAYRIDDPSIVSGAFDTHWPRIAASPVGQDISHDKALEFSYHNGGDDGSTHWVALPVSRQHHLDPALLQSALAQQLALTS